MVCAPKDKVVGVVNYASPLPLFYSNMADDDYDLNYTGTAMIKYIFEKGIFFLTINFINNWIINSVENTHIATL